LYLTGRLPPEPGVAIVGTRQASPQGQAFATALAIEFVEAGVSVLSGGAAGIDAAAHRGALSAGGRTLVVAPAGFQRPFPALHRELFEQVVESGGGYLSLCAPDEPAQQPRFFARNASLVALSRVVVVVEAGFRSGARNAAKYARQFGRKLFVVPAAPWVAQGRGCIAELKAGAQPLESAKDVLAFLESCDQDESGSAQLGLPLSVPALPTSTRPTSQPSQPKVPPGKSPVLDAVRAGAATADEICQCTRLGASEVQRELFALRLQGVLGQDPTGALYCIGP
jgi:DNA processing protein